MYEGKARIEKLRKVSRLLANFGGGVIALICGIVGFGAYIGVAVWVFLQGNLAWFLLWLFLGGFAVGLGTMVIVLPLAVLASKLFEVGSKR